MSAAQKQAAGARKRVSKAAATRKPSGLSSRTGPFKPTIDIPRMLPVATSSSSQTASTNVAKPNPDTRLATFVEEPGTLQQIGREADAALAIGKRVLTMLNVESKCKSESFTSIPVTWTTVSTQPLTTIGQGDTDSQRDGDSMKLKTWDGVLQFTRGGVDAVMAWAFIQEGPTFVTGGQQIFEGAGTANAPLSQPLYDARLGFRILHSGVVALTQEHPIHLQKFHHRFNHDVQFFNNSTTVYEGNVSFYCVSNNAGGGPQPTFSYDGQITWIDN